MIRRILLCILSLACAVPALSQAQMNLNIYDQMQWRCIGPHRGGRTVGLAGIPSRPNVFFIGVNNGGVWKSTDYGQTWYSIFDGQPTQSVGALAVAESNPDTIYVASGEGLQRPDLSVGNGIYKSTDGGKTWQHLGLRDAEQINSIIVDPKDPDRVFVAAIGHPYGPNEERGVFRSTDGGASWQKVLYKGPDTGAMKVAFDPQNTNTLYADLWTARRPPWTTGNSYNGPGSGLYKSTDGGNTWNQIGAGSNDDPSHPGGLPGWDHGLGRIGFDIAPSDSNRLYALADATKNGGLYRSDDGGNTWTLVNTENRIWGRGSDFAEVRVDPHHPDTIYVANTSTYRSTDAGKTFNAIKGAPGGDDYHTVWLNPEHPEIIALAADQGATISSNNGDTWSSWYNQPTAQFYHVITDDQFPYWVYGGQQESGSVGIASRSDYGEITFRDWHPVGTEEYGYVAPDPLHPEIVFGGKGTRFNQITGQNQDVSPIVIRTGEYRFNRTAPLIFEHADPHALLLGSNVLFKTIDGGHSWQIISPDLTRPGVGPEAAGVPANFGQFNTWSGHDAKHRGVIYSIGPSFKDPNTIWIGTDDGLIQVTRDGGKSWQNITPPAITAWSKVAQIEASHFDEHSAYVAVNRLRLDDLHAYIYRTHDAGKSWTKITNGIPDTSPVNTVREDPVRKGLLFAGTENGVWYSLDDGDHWRSLQFNLPTSSVRDLVVHGDDIVVGTHGRSFWILDDITPLRQMTAETASATHLYQPQTAIRLRRDQNTDTPLPPDVPAGQNPPDGAILNYSLAPGFKGPVVIEISDASGKLIRRFSSSDKPFAPSPKDVNVPYYWLRMPRVPSAAPGMHRFVWDLRYPAPHAQSHEYPISAVVHDTPRYPLGPIVTPGTYTVKLTSGGGTSTQKLTVKMDPRVKLTSAQLQSMFDDESKLASAVNRTGSALDEVRSVREQIKDLQPSATAHAQITNALTQLDRQLAEVEGHGGRFGAPSSTDSLAAVSGSLSGLYGSIDAADAEPTAKQQQLVGELLTRADVNLQKWQSLRASLTEVNAQLKAAGLTPLDPTKHQAEPEEDYEVDEP